MSKPIDIDHTKCPASCVQSPRIWEEDRQVIPEAAVEAAASAVEDALQTGESVHTIARFALEAAHPHMLMRGDGRYVTQYRPNKLGEWQGEVSK